MNYLINGKILKTREQLRDEASDTKEVFLSEYHYIIDQLTPKQYSRLPVNTTYANKLEAVKKVSRNQVIHLLVDRALEFCGNYVRANEAYKNFTRRSA